MNVVRFTGSSWIKHGTECTLCQCKVRPLGARVSTLPAVPGLRGARPLGDGELDSACVLFKQCWKLKFVGTTLTTALHIGDRSAGQRSLCMSLPACSVATTSCPNVANHMGFIAPSIMEDNIISLIFIWFFYEFHKIY